MQNHIKTVTPRSKTGLKLLNLKKKCGHSWKCRKERIRKANAGSDHPSSVQTTGHFIKWALNVMVSLTRKSPDTDVDSAYVRS